MMGLLAALDLSLLIAVAAIFLVGGIVKGVIGIGMPAISMAFLTLFFPPLVAIPLTALPTMLTNLVQFLRADKTLRSAQIRQYRVLAVVMMLVIFIFGYFLRAFPESILLAVLGVVMVFFAVQSLAGFRVDVSAWAGWQVLSGAVAGVIGGLSSVFSPPVVMYLLGRNVEREQFMAATGFLFFMGYLPLLLALVLNEVLRLDLVLAGLFGLAFGLVGFFIGERIRQHISQALFRRLILLFFLLMGMRLIFIGALNS